MGSLSDPFGFGSALVGSAPVGNGPDFTAVDPATHTLNGVSVFDASTCNATVQSGCAQLGTIPTAIFPSDVQVDPANQTLYATNGENTISAFDLRSCNAADLACCAIDTPGTVTLPAPGGGFEVTLWVAVDPANHSVYVTNQKDDSVIVVNANVCNGSDLAGCATLDPPEIHTGADPEVLTLDPDTQTLYTANQVDNDVSVIAATRCDAQSTRGCRARSTAPPATATTRAAATRPPPPLPPASAPTPSPSTPPTTASTPPTSRTPASPRSTATPATQSTPKAVTAHKPNRSSVTTPTRSPSTRQSRPPTSPTAKA